MRRILILGFLIIWVGACAPDPYLRGLILKDENQYEKSLAAFQEIKPSHRLYRHAEEEINRLKLIIILKAEGEKQAEAGNLETAVAAYEKVIVYDPESPAIKARLASLQDQLNKYREQQQQREETLDEIESAYQAKRFEEATRLIENLLKTEPKNSRARELQGRVKRAWEETKAASGEHLQRGRKYQESGDPLRACSEFNLAREAWSKNPEVEDLQSQALAAVPAALARNLKSAQDLVNKGEAEKALEQLEMNLNCQPHDKDSLELYPKVLRRLAIEAYNKSEYKKAIGYFERERKYNPEDPTLKQYLGKASKLLKELKKN